MHSNTLQLETSAFVIVDVQEAFRQSILSFDEIVRKIIAFTGAARFLNLPILITEQYPKGLGQTIGEISRVLPTEIEFVEKSAFSACGARAFGEKLTSLGARQIIVAGIETHVCVNQTVHDLLAQNYQVHVLADAVSSRTLEDKQIALHKMQASGAIISSVEMALFELMRDSRHEQFKAIQKLIK